MTTSSKIPAEVFLAFHTIEDYIEERRLNPDIIDAARILRRFFMANELRQEMQKDLEDLRTE